MLYKDLGRSNGGGRTPPPHCRTYCRATRLRYRARRPCTPKAAGYRLQGRVTFIGSPPLVVKGGAWISPRRHQYTARPEPPCNNFPGTLQWRCQPQGRPQLVVLWSIRGRVEYNTVAYGLVQLVVLVVFSLDNALAPKHNGSMNRLSTAKRTQVVSALVEGVSVRATCRMTGTAKGTVLSLLVDLGAACESYQDRTLRNLKCKRIQCDELWQFIYAKAKNLPEEMRGAFGVGDVWTWVAIDADSKLVPSWAVGRRDGFTAQAFIRDLADRLATRVQLTTDGHKVYLEAVEGAFGNDIDYAMLVKMYEGDSGQRDAQARYSPPSCLGTRKVCIAGQPDPRFISTSYTERQNLSMRMGMRRFTRLTNAFSKKVDNHKAALALYFMHYNFARIHKTLRVTPAMEAGVSDHVWALEEIARLAA